MNIILNVDSYKASQYCQYPEDTKYVSSYVEARSGGQYEEVLVFGLQAFIKKYLMSPITRENIDEAESFWAAHGVPFNKEGWEYILNKRGGYLPVEIESVEEGTVLPAGNVIAQIVNTDPKCYWLTSYLETAMLRGIWYPTTVATNSYRCKQLIRKALLETSEDVDGQIAFKLHDFGARGVSSEESAALGGMAHLVNFNGSDTVSGVLAARRYYNEPMAGFSIPATEHSTITSWGKGKGEVEAYRNLLERYPSGLVACVSDSYDLGNAVSEIWGNELKDMVVARDGVLVVRPDSGDPSTVVVDTLQRLDSAFGSRENSKGYRVLNDKVRVIQGDGINESSIADICDSVIAAGYSLDNVAFGMGGALLQQLDRDTARFAMKCSAIEVGGFWQDVYKQPKTDLSKSSKAGRLALIRTGSSYATVRSNTVTGPDNLLEVVYRNGKLLKSLSFSKVRENVRK